MYSKNQRNSIDVMKSHRANRKKYNAYMQKWRSENREKSRAILRKNYYFNREVYICLRTKPGIVEDAGDRYLENRL